MKKQIIQIILMLLLFVLIVIVCKEIIAADIDVDESGASEAKFYINPEGYNKAKSLAGIYTAMKKYKKNWVNLDTSKVSLKNYGGEGTDEYINGIINSRGALCFGHYTKGPKTGTISEKIRIIDIDYNSSVKELKLAYMAYMSYKNETVNDSLWKNRIKNWICANCSDYGISIQSTIFETNDTYDYSKLEEVNEYSAKITNRKFATKTTNTVTNENAKYNGTSYTYLGPIKVKVDNQHPITGATVKVGRS